MALDIALLMQFELREVAEPSSGLRGASSAMPHKRNPTACMLAIAAARRSPALLAGFITGMLQEHERGLGNWQNEWELVHGMVQAAGVALESMVEAIEGLHVDPARMRVNIDATDGTVFAERAMMLLAPGIGRDAAYRQVQSALRDTGAPPDLPGLRTPEDYLGCAEDFRRRLLDGEI